MSLVGKTVALYLSIKGEKKRKERDSIELDIKGVIEDKFYAKDIDRSVLITSIESYNLSKEHNINLDNGILGENILIDYNPYHLPSGTQIQIGDVILEINQKCTLCKSLSTVNNKLPKLLKDDRGIFAKVIQSGKINIGDKIYLLKSAVA